MADRTELKNLIDLMNAGGEPGREIGISEITVRAILALIEMDGRLSALEATLTNTQTEQERP